MGEETTASTNVTNKSAGIKMRTQDGYTKGVLKTAKEMFTAKKTYKEIFDALVTIYVTKGRTPAQAKHNAQSTCFNAMKLLGIQRSDAESEKTI